MAMLASACLPLVGPIVLPAVFVSSARGHGWFVFGQSPVPIAVASRQVFLDAWKGRRAFELRGEMAVVGGVAGAVHSDRHGGLRLSDGVLLAFWWCDAKGKQMDLRWQAQAVAPAVSGPGSEDAAWTAVRRWPGMRGEDKLAWLFLWLRSRGGREQISTTPAEVAADQGVTADAGRSRLKNLAAQGLILVRNRERATGVWLVEVCDPGELEVGRVVKSDGQQLLFDDLDSSGGPDPESLSSMGGEIDGSATAYVCSLGVVGGHSVQGRTEEPPEDPRCAAEEPPEDPRSAVFEGLLYPRARSKSLVFEKSLSSKSSQGVQGDGSGDRGSSGGSSVAGAEEDRDEVSALATLIEMRRQQVAPPRQAEPVRAIGESLSGRSHAEQLPRFGALHAQSRADAHALAGEIYRRVGDRKLKQSPVLRVAWAVVEGRVPRDRLYRLLGRLDELRASGQLTCPASAYFVRAAQGVFRDFSLDWPAKAKSKAK